MKVTYQGEGHIKVKVKYLHPFKFYVAHTLCKQVVCIRLKCYLLSIVIATLLRGHFPCTVKDFLNFLTVQRRLYCALKIRYFISSLHFLISNIFHILYFVVREKYTVNANDSCIPINNGFEEWVSKPLLPRITHTIEINLI